MKPAARSLVLLLALALSACDRAEKFPPAPATAKNSGGSLSAAPPVSGEDASEARTALVIGVDDYRDTYFTKLSAPDDDARLMAEKLRTLGFEVTLRLNPGRGEMLTLSDEFGQSLARRQGVGLFYFSGHGSMKPDEADPNFLIPAGSRITSREDLPQEAFNAQRVANRMKEAGNRLNLVFLDACRSNDLPSRSKNAAAGLASMRGASGLMFFFATQPNEVALEATETSSSVFTDALLQHMATPGLSFMDMMADVTDATERASLTLTAGSETKIKQSPFMAGTLSGRFSFAPGVAARPASVPASEVSSHLDLAGIGKSSTIPLPGGVKVTLRSIPAGSFTMGSPANETNPMMNLGAPDRRAAEKQVRVTLTKDYWLAQTEFTQGQWKAVMGSNPSNFKGDDLPAETVSWNEAQECLTALNAKAKLPAGWTWALPTEAQWEFGCRAGTTTATSFGDTLTADQANFNGNYPFGTTREGTYLEKTAPVGSYKANEWGLHDMHGNVWEWCADPWDGSAELPGGTDPLGTIGSDRTIRGGSGGSRGQHCRSAYRAGNAPDTRGTALGFRPAAIRAGR